MNVIAEVRYGSKLQGLELPTSDIDLRGVFIPDPRDILLSRVKDKIDLSTQQTPGKMSTAEDVDRNLYSLRFVVEKLLTGDIGMLDMLHAEKDNLIQTSSTWDYLVKHRTCFYSKNMDGLFGQVKREIEMATMRSNRLYALDKVLNVLDDIADDPSAKLERYAHLMPIEGTTLRFIDDHRQRPEFTRFYRVNGKNYQLSMNFEMFRTAMLDRKKNYGERMLAVAEAGGTNWKSLTQALRVGYQLVEIYRDGDYTFPLKEKAFLLDVKQGKLSLEAVREELDSVMRDVELYKAQSSYPETLSEETVARWENFVVDVYGLAIRKMQNDAVA